LVVVVHECSKNVDFGCDDVGLEDLLTTRLGPWANKLTIISARFLPIITILEGNLRDATGCGTVRTYTLSFLALV
jgi:hypothetical protein